MKWQTETARLIEELEHFGLNPQDWTLVYKPRQSTAQIRNFEIQNKSDLQFCFEGQAKMDVGNLYWESLKWSEVA